MQYDLTEHEARHMEKYRALGAANQVMIDKLIDRHFEFQAEVDRVVAERNAAEKAE